MDSYNVHSYDNDDDYITLELFRVD